MDNRRDRKQSLSHPLRWLPEFLEFGKRRFRTQGRVLSAAILAGIVAGIGGVAFSLAGQFVVQMTLQGAIGQTVQGDDENPVGAAKREGPAGEAHVDWLPEIPSNFCPWLLLVIPTLGGL